MLQKLQQKWKVNTFQLFVILCTFAIGGSLTGYAGKKLMAVTGVKGWAFVPLYIVAVTIIWPAMVLVVSIPLGQFNFFMAYLKNMWKRVTGKTTPAQAKINMAVFASGAGSNAKKIIEHFKNHPQISVALIVCNKAGAGVSQVANNAGIPFIIIEREQFFKGNHYIPLLKQYHITYIVLAGFLWKVPAGLVAAYPSKIINIHPALLPKFGGRGMYGNFVHEAVIAAGEKQSGITIHFVDELYDHGATIFQAGCDVSKTDNASSLAAKIHALEHAHYATVIEKTLLQKQR
jgi:formyltetrahydrofolate-dependent phosphoribosylglycinamide formyltransferase